VGFIVALPIVRSGADPDSPSIGVGALRTKAD
jgi:hypothetical protein